MKRTGELLLVLTALIWGSAFVAQSKAAEYLGAFTINGVRNFIGCAVLVPLFRLTSRAPVGREKQRVLKGGIICGIFLFIAANIQQFALGYVDALGNKQPVGKVSFITSLYIVLVPVFGIFMKRKTGLKTWLSVAIACVGMYLLTGAEGLFNMTGGDLLSLVCAGVFACQIIAIDIFAPEVDCIRLAHIEFGVCGVLSMLCAFIFETPAWSNLWAARWSILYCGIFSSGIAYTLQMIGQKKCKPQVSSLIMSLESVFGALSGFVLLGERLSGAELAGCGLCLIAVALTQIKLKGLKDA